MDEDQEYKTLTIFSYFRHHLFLILMKIKYCLLLTILLVIQSISPLHAQTTEGRDFWVSFGKNFHNEIDANDQVDLYIRIVNGNQSATDVELYFTDIGSSESFTIPAQQVFTYKLIYTQSLAVYNSTTGKSNRSIHITSTERVSVYAMNQAYQTTDATNLYPVTAFGTEYYHMSYTPYSPFLDAYLVIATENNTNIYHNGGSTPIETLNAGQVYYKTSTTDMTGDRISSDKPVAFFASCQYALIPAGFNSADCLFQQLAPVHTWGKNFFVPVSDPRLDNYPTTKDRVRIVASQNNTTINQMGATLITNSGGQTNYVINAGQFIELEVVQSNYGCYIQANKPIGVCTYLTGNMYNGNGVSDPAQAWIPAIEQMVTEAKVAPFFPSGSTHLSYHGFLIITPTDTKNYTMISVGGGAYAYLTIGTWQDNPHASMSYFTLDIDSYGGGDVNFNFNNPNGLFIMGYGIGSAESYYYLAGSAMRDLDAAFYANDVYFQDLPNTTFCDKNVHFQAEIEDFNAEQDSIKWYIENVEYEPASGQSTWNKDFETGKYHITMWVRFANGVILSKSGILNVRVFWTKIKNLRH